ncbi:MAG: helix-turn-helix domain-containing protein [Haloferacaceae archaeon]
MSDSMHEYMQQENLECEGLLECLHGLKALDVECFRVLNNVDEALTVDEIASQVDRERSTAYRSVQRLLQRGLIQKEQVNYEQGGYYHVYKPKDASDLANDMQRMLNDWYAQMGSLIDEFQTKYDDSRRD